MWPPLANEALAKQKPGREENPQAGLTHSRPFSYLFYVASKPTGSNDHGIKRLIRRGRLCVKPGIGLDRCRSYMARRGDRVPLSFSPTDEGILPDRMIAELAADGGIRAHYPFAPGQIQPASLDL